MVQVLPGPARLPARDGAPDGLLVEARGARQQLQLGRRLDRPCVHQRVVAVGDLDVLQAEPPTEALVVEADAAAVESEVLHRGTHLLAEIEANTRRAPAPSTRSPPRTTECGHRRRPALARGPSPPSPTGRAGCPRPRSAGAAAWSGSSRRARGWGARDGAGRGSRRRAAASSPLWATPLKLVSQKTLSGVVTTRPSSARASMSASSRSRLQMRSGSRCRPNSGPCFAFAVVVTASSSRRRDGPRPQKSHRRFWQDARRHAPLHRCPVAARRPHPARTGRQRGRRGGPGGRPPGGSEPPGPRQPRRSG